MSRKEPPENMYTTPKKKSKTGEGATASITSSSSAPKPFTLSPMQSACCEVKKTRDRAQDDYLKSVDRNKVLFKQMRNSKRAYTTSLEHEKKLLHTLQGLNATVEMMEKAAAAGVTGNATPFSPGFNPFVPEENEGKPAAAADPSTLEEDDGKAAAAAAAAAAAEEDYCFDEDDEEMANHEVDLTPSKPQDEVGKAAELSTHDDQGLEEDDLD